VPRAGLTPEVVITEAASICDDTGFERLTLAAVAQRFGVAVPSLYKHIAGLDALRREVAIRGIRELGDELAAAVAGDGGLAEIAQAYRDYARSHPGRYAATLRAPGSDDADARAASQAVLDTVLGVLTGYGLTGADAIDATRALRASLHGFVELEAVGGFGLPQDVDRSFDRLIEIMDAALRNWKP
jgi:AcrR family transcriptional regulator